MIGQSEASCSFCGRPRRSAIIAGPGGIYICADCVPLAEEVLSSRAPATTPVATLAPVPARQGSALCSFCGKPRERVRGLAATASVGICDECLDLCDEIFADG